MPDGRGGEAKPSIFQFGRMLSLVFSVMSLIAWWIVSGWFAHTCTSRSPPSHTSCERVVREDGHPPELQRPGVVQAVAVVEQRRSDQHASR